MIFKLKNSHEHEGNKKFEDYGPPEGYSEKESQQFLDDISNNKLLDLFQKYKNFRNKHQLIVMILKINILILILPFINNFIFNVFLKLK